MSFRREKYVPRGGPNGGDGGKGGDIIIVASGNHRTLLDLKYRQHLTARHGGYGGGSDRTGQNADDVEIPVPIGTVVKDAETGEILADLVQDGERFVVARGGRGGRGNAFFATATHQAPKFAQPGEKGEEHWISLELKLLADVGIIGLPNVGKSTFISRISAARPRIADYPFTTLTPNLGVVKYADAVPFVIADIPGLIEGAHEGHGLGIRFLRHVERTGVLLHMIDLSQESDAPATKAYETINRELALYSPKLMAKPQIVVLNKIDLPEVRRKMKKEIDIFKKKGIKIFAISAVTGEGVSEVLAEVVRKLKAEEIGKSHEQ